MYGFHERKIFGFILQALSIRSFTFTSVLKEALLGEASVNLYYTIMSIYGWILWAKRNQQDEHVVNIMWSTKKEWLQELLFFASFYIVIFFALSYLKKDFAPGAIPWADAFASSTAFTGMWLMARKKVESWYWWIATNMCINSFVLCKTLCFHKRVLCDTFNYCILGIDRMEKKSE